MKASLLKVTGGLFLITMLQACGSANTGAGGDAVASGLAKADPDFAVSGNSQMTMAAHSDEGEAVAECQEAVDQSNAQVQNDYDVHVFIRKIEVDGKTVLRARFVGKNSNVKTQVDDKDSGYVDLTNQGSAQASGIFGTSGSATSSAVLMTGLNFDQTLGLAFDWTFNTADQAQVKLESGAELSALLNSSSGSVLLGQHKATAQSQTQSQTQASGSADVSAPNLTCEKAQ